MLKPKRPIVVIEPHPDDAFLSLGHHIEKIWRDREVRIVSVYSNERRGREAGEFADAVGASSSVIGLTETNMAGELSRRLETSLREPLEALSNSIVVCPIGLQHPDHLRVRNSVDEYVSKGTEVWYYLDTPYQTKQKLSEELREATTGMTVVSIAYPGARKWRHVSIFKSQAKFFHFNPMKDLRIPETVLTRG